MKIGVLMGGLSSEREVSLRSGRAVAGSLRRMGFDVVGIDLRAEKPEIIGQDADPVPVTPQGLADFLLKNRIDCVFIALHGGMGENGAIQGFLEVLGIPYTGSGIMASSLAMDKLISKRLFLSAGLMVPEYILLSPEEGRESSLSTGSEVTAGDAKGMIREILEKIGLPLVVKPVREGSSVGVSVVDRESDILKALKEGMRYGACLVERYIEGKEVHVGIVKNRAIGAVEVRPKERFYSYRAKYTQGMTDYIIPPDLPEGFLEKALQAGLTAHRSLGCRGATRVDLIVTSKGDVYVLEVNTIPGMTETSLLPKIAASSGLSFDDLVREILSEATVGGEVTVGGRTGGNKVSPCATPEVTVVRCKK